MTDHGIDEDSGEPFDIDAGSAYPARVFDYLLGGKDNFAADREVAHSLWDPSPGIDTARRIARAVHGFVVEAVRYLAGEAGIRQFLNLGNVVRIEDNVHEVAQTIVPDARVVYVVSDAVVLAHAHELRTVSPAGTTTFVVSDLRDLDALLQEVSATLDFTEPIGLIASGVLHYVSGEADPYAFLARLVEPLGPGSHVVVSHAASDLAGGVLLDVAKRQEGLNRGLRWPLTPRSRDEVARFFQGLELVDPGIATIDRWRPVSAPASQPAAAAGDPPDERPGPPGPSGEPPTEAPADSGLPWYAAVARKPG